MIPYKELLMKRDAFLELRMRVDLGLARDPVGSPLEVDFDERTGDVLVTGVYDGVRRTHRIHITEEPTVSSD